MIFKNLFFSLLVCMAPAISEARQKGCSSSSENEIKADKITTKCLLAEHVKIKDLLPCQERIPIFQKDIGTTGFITPEPGCYCLAEDIIWNPATANTAAITLTDDVELDLNCHSITQVNSTPSFAIRADNRENIVIKDGFIKNIQGVGIAVVACHNVVIDGCDILDIGPNAVGQPSAFISFLDPNVANSSSTFIEVRNCRCSGLQASATSAARGIAFVSGSSLNAKNYLIEDCIIENMNGTTANAIIAGGTDYVINRCNIQNIVGDPTDGNNARGIVVLNTAPNPNTGLVISNCQINNCSAAQGGGIQIGSADNGIITDVEINTITGTCSNAFGIVLSTGGSRHGIVIRNCNVRDVSTTDGASYATGFEVGGYSDCVYENCGAFNISVNNPFVRNQAAGFTSGNCNAITYRNCTASEITARLTASGELVNSRAVGFGYTLPAGTSVNANGTARGTVWENCIAEFVTVTAPGNPANGIGFDLAEQIGATMEGCIAKNCGIGIFNEFNAATPTNSVYLGRAGVCATTQPITFANNFATDNVIQNNTVSGNSAFGIRDETPAGRNAYFKNTAMRNGVNYFGPTFSPQACPPVAPANSTPIRLWQLPQAPCSVNNNNQTEAEFDNLDIR